MKIYDVTVQRTEFREHTFRVKAGSPPEAGETALEAACNYDFDDSPVFHADETPTAVVEMAAEVEANPPAGNRGHEEIHP